MKVKEIVSSINKVVNSLSLETQYIGFRVAYFIDLFIATLIVVSGNLQLGLLFAILGIGLGIISNQKRFLINQELFLKKLEKQ